MKNNSINFPFLSMKIPSDKFDIWSFVCRVNEKYSLCLPSMTGRTLENIVGML